MGEQTKELDVVGAKVDVGDGNVVCAWVDEGFVYTTAVNEGHGVFLFGEGGLPGVESLLEGEERGVVA